MPTISNNDIAKAIYFATVDKKGNELKEALQNSVKFLAKKNLISKSKDILASLQKVVDDNEGTVRAVVSSPSKLTQSAKEDLMHILKRRYHAKTVALEEKIDPGLLGGLKVEVGDEVVDLSIKNKIKKLQDHLIKNA